MHLFAYNAYRILQNSKGHHQMLGQTVTVIIDRPLGSYHPEHPTLFYPINYGYIEGTLAPDGEEEDAYVIGIDKPVSEFTGRVIAVIEREDDVEHKWVVAPENTLFTKEEIAKLTDFQERYFKSKIIMFQ